ncbi:hypothetical protein L2E82_47984 [Cichorium intybus]|uniref:Uncharacterized protein n=1 Tax=Cichorium intybus TaxID=13427 RepID=A0ACB8Z168_CICIN|nr:hypothetical protein L2E82_47984 [Cichorium intybus]
MKLRRVTVMPTILDDLTGIIIKKMSDLFGHRAVNMCAPIIEILQVPGSSHHIAKANNCPVTGFESHRDLMLEWFLILPWILEMINHGKVNEQAGLQQWGKVKLRQEAEREREYRRGRNKKKILMGVLSSAKVFVVVLNLRYSASCNQSCWCDCMIRRS